MKFLTIRNARGFFSDYYLTTVAGRGGGAGGRRIADQSALAAFKRCRRIFDHAAGRLDGWTSVRDRLVEPLFEQVLKFFVGAADKHLAGLYDNPEASQNGGQPRLVVQIADPGQDLDARAAKEQDSPQRQLEKFLLEPKVNVRYGILTNGEKIRLIRRPGEGPRGAYLELDLDACIEREDVESFTLFYRIFGAWGFTPAADGIPPIEHHEQESRKYARKVSEDLKRAVFNATEYLVRGLLNDAAEQKGVDPLNLTAAQLALYRDAALKALYRILFILYAEARHDKLRDHRLYMESYSLEFLIQELMRYGTFDEIPSNRYGHWERLRALFRIYDQGMPRVETFEHIPPRGGTLFKTDDDVGRLLDTARLSDRRTAVVLRTLTTTHPRRGVGVERVSFRELDIEQLGHVYEGLLEHEPRISKEAPIECEALGRKLVLTPAEIDRVRKSGDLILRGDEALRDKFMESAKEAETTDDEEETEEPTTDGDDSEDEAASSKGKKYCTLIREIHPGAFYFMPGSQRKGTGSYYTPRELVADIIRHALGPLTDGKTAQEILALRVIDPACGSGHFLISAMRFLGQKLHAAFVHELKTRAQEGFVGEWDTNADASDESARAAGSEARAWCKRLIAESCLFGVDLNPTAVELARVALWIESLAGDRPLTYFEHHIRHGNSLLSSWSHNLHLSPLEKDTRSDRLPDLFTSALETQVASAATKRRQIELATHAGKIASVDEWRYKEDRRREAQEAVESARMLFDLRLASAFGLPEIWDDWILLTERIGEAKALAAFAESRPWWPAFCEVRDKQFFHWELEFPEVFTGASPGFDAVIGNPPWDKIKPDRKEFYAQADVLIRAFKGVALDSRIRELEAAHPELECEFKTYSSETKTLAAVIGATIPGQKDLVEVVGEKSSGDPDIFKFFLPRSCEIVRAGGRVGLIVPSAIYNNEGCTGLRKLLFERAKVERFYAFENREKIFPIDSRYKFLSLCFRKLGVDELKSGADGQFDFEAAFMRHDLEELESTVPPPAPWMVRIRKSEIERLSPGTLAFLEYRSPKDREILLRMYGYDVNGNPVNPRPLLGDQGPGTWNTKFYREFDMSNDRDVWTDPKTGKLFSPRQILGRDPKDFSETRARMAAKGFWPLYQDAHIHQYTDNFKPFMRWLSLEAHRKKYKKDPDSEEELVYRDKARSTDERTMIAFVLPPQSAFGHTLNGIKTDGDPHKLCWILNSLTFDFSARFRVGGQHVSPYLMRPISIIEEKSLAKVRTSRLHNADFQQSTPYDQTATLKKIADWEITAARMYALTPDDFAHILTTFPLFAKKRPAFFAYLRERLAEWRKDAL